VKFRKGHSPRRRWALGLSAAAVTGTVLSGTMAVAAYAAPAQPATAGQAAIAGRAAAGGYTPASRTLKMGMHGADIKRLQVRLRQLGYYPGAADGHFGMNTEEAVWAFQEVQNLHASGKITWPVEKKLVYPRTPKALVRRGGSTRVEISLGRHVLYVYHSNKIVLISHISSGGGYYYCDNGCSRAITPTGNFHTTWRVRGWHTSPLGQMYNPVFFYRGYAVHGDTYVPLNPVSHGCVRVPMDVASIYPGLVPRKGIPVYVRASG
jgi:peptidoglycan hydrolase-like protein with peptidoglycan-binding domain